jgi:hypothetical protein
MAIYTASRQLISGVDMNTVNAQLYSTQSLTAAIVQTQAGAIAGALITSSAVLLTVNNTGDVVALPPGYAGLEIFIANPAGHDAQVFGSGTDTINDVATATGVTQAASKNATYRCVVGPTSSTPAAKWYRNLTA